MPLPAITGLLPVPRMVPFVLWAGLVVELLSEYNLSAPTDESSWQSWAVQFAGLTDTASDEVPDPYGFSDWRSWAERWIQIQG